MRDQVFLLILGFVLTSVAGGSIAYFFQNKTDERHRRESERAAAATVFEEISRAMDRRLYRMWLLQWGLKSGDNDRIEKALDGYRTVLTEWNDSLNRNLALTYRYFGKGVWKLLDRALYEEFARVGRVLEGRYRAFQDLNHRNADEENLDEVRVMNLSLERQLKALNNEIYILNRFMVSMIQHGIVGIYQLRNSKEWPEAPPWEGKLKRGSQGPRVSEWQRSLNLIGPNRIDVDGRFGRATYEATVTFQQAHALKADGIIGESTRRTMEELLPEFIAPTF